MIPCIPEKKKLIVNPYTHQEKSFPDLPRIFLVALLLGVPTAGILFFQGHSSPFRSNSNVSNTENVNAVFSKPLSSFQNDHDPNLKPMVFQLPHESSPTTFQAYIQPDVSTFYNDPPGSRQVKQMSFRGIAGKFINLSPMDMSLYWDNGKSGIFIANMPPFQAVGTATHLVHKFFFQKQKADKGEGEGDQNQNQIMHRIHIHPNQNIYVYDAFELGHASVDDLSPSHLELYHLQKHNLEFAKTYREFTGRDWLSLYPKRKQPIYKMWNADYFGQQHWVTSKETHFVREPPEDKLGHLSHKELHRDRSRHFDLRDLSQYRGKVQNPVHSDGNGDDDVDLQMDDHEDGKDVRDAKEGSMEGTRNDEMLNMTMTVLSCAPRVFEIKNFLSQAEVDHIVHMATGMKLSLSTTSGSDGSDRKADTRSRTSHNSWVARSRSPIMDSIYGRAADLMQIDEALLRTRDAGERLSASASKVHHKSSNAEELQLVHYAKSEQYTAHHDFTYPNTHLENQPARFATLLLYLNEGMEGGETSFPRWVNSHTSSKLNVTPEMGKAVLFYSQLPDGNMDDLSQHAAEPVRGGEKWLINLWTWDPKFR